jgi:hypothetical protein
MPFGSIAFVAFWAAAIKLWFLDGAKIPLICICLWLLAGLAVPRLHWPGAVFVVAECVLAVVLLLIERYKSALL